jgi:hypothetical protein
MRSGTCAQCRRGGMSGRGGGGGGERRGRARWGTHRGRIWICFTRLPLASEPARRVSTEAHRWPAEPQSAQFSARHEAWRQSGRQEMRGPLRAPRAATARHKPPRRARRRWVVPPWDIRRMRSDVGSAAAALQRHFRGCGAASFGTAATAAALGVVSNLNLAANPRVSLPRISLPPRRHGSDGATFSVRVRSLRGAAANTQGLPLGAARGTCGRAPAPTHSPHRPRRLSSHRRLSKLLRPSWPASRWTRIKSMAAGRKLRSRMRDGEVP